MRTIREEAQRNINRAARRLEARYNAVAKAMLKTGDVQGAEAVVAEARDIVGHTTQWQIATHSKAVQAKFPATAQRIPNVTVRNSVGMELKLIPPGTFVMGFVSGGQPGHRVQITKPFYLGVYEVTNAEWKRVIGDPPSKWQGDDYPVEQVSRAQVAEFCRKLSDLPEEKAAGRIYRLPTEAEWEYACRGGVSATWPFGEEQAKLGDYAWFAGNSGDRPIIDSDAVFNSLDFDGWMRHLQEHGCRSHAVGTKKPNAWGLYDMLGNVQEMCSDRDGPEDHKPAVDPSGPERGDSYIDKGGNWASHAQPITPASRHGEKECKYMIYGFRIACSQR
jgi:formylglycine-generating enzyme required for sulfatase activity